MPEQVTCGPDCGACRFKSEPDVIYRSPRWVQRHVGIIAYLGGLDIGSDGHVVDVGFWTKCGARLSFDAQDGPVVTRMVQAPPHTHPDECSWWYDGCNCAEGSDAIARAVAQERERCAKAKCTYCAAGNCPPRKWENGKWWHGGVRCMASAIWGPPEPAQEEAELGYRAYNMRETDHIWPMSVPCQEADHA